MEEIGIMVQKKIVSHITDVPNAYWHPDTKIFEFGTSKNSTTRKPFAALDVVAHEYTHAITHDEIVLNYSGESGALSESFSDIFGAVVEFYCLGSAGNYYQGDSIVIGGAGMLRDMTNPHNTNQPRTYKDLYWSYSDTNNVVVHTNSGVQNYWFYLLAEGDNTLNNSGYWVDGIGRDKAAKIVYRNITSYVVSYSGYLHAAIGSVISAMELYGNCSYEAMQTYLAWQAVGVSFPLISLSNYNISTGRANSLIMEMIYYSHPTIHLSAMNQLNVSRNISSINKPVIFSAGSEIRLLPGFVSNKDFHAYICDNTGSRGSGNPSHKSVGNGAAFYTNEDTDEKDELQNKKETIVIYPNPNNGKFTVNTNIDPQEVLSVQVFSMLGQSIYQQAGLPNNVIQLPSSASGVFYVEVITTTERFIRKMVVN